MKKWMTDYFDNLFSLEGYNDKPRLLEQFAPNFKIHRGSDLAVVETREEWVDYLCSQADKYRAKISYGPEPLGIYIDERTGWTSAKIQQEFLDPVTRKEIQPKVFFFVIFKFCIEQNRIKAERQLIVQIKAFC